MKHRLQSNFNRKQSAFTLIELLVVIAVIAILAAILFPVFGRIRESARRSACMSNMKQIGLGLMQYSQDYDETLPTNAPVSGWFIANDLPNYANSSATNCISATQPYIRNWQVFLCPSAKLADNAPPWDGYNPIASPNPSSTNYRINAVLIQRKLSALKNPAALIWLQDTFVSSSHLFMRPAGNNSLPIGASENLVGWNEISSGTYYITTHFGGGNMLFADGHVKWRTRDGISAREFGINSDVKGPTTISAPMDTNQISG